MSTHSEILIIGAGIFGTSTAYHLSKTFSSPPSITVLDRSPYPPHHAASTDINKIVRSDYTTRFYMDLAYEAQEAWKTNKTLQDEHGTRFFHESGWVALTNEGNDFAERIRKNLRDRGSDGTSDISVPDMKSKWGNLLADTEFENDPKIVSAYWNPEAGWADAGDAVAAMLKEALARGVKYEVGDVKELVPGENGIQSVETHGGHTYTANKILLATGAWTSALMSPLEDRLDIAETDRVERQLTAAGVCVAHYKLSDEEYSRLSSIPVIIYGDRGEVLPPPASSHLLKFTNARSFKNTITTPTGHQISVPPPHPQTVVPKRLQDETLSSIISKTLPAFVTRDVAYWRLCWDAITPTQDQLITRHPSTHLANLYLAVGGSFHSWKFLPTIGMYVANVLHGTSNGAEKDARWAWKAWEAGAPEGRGAHEKVVPRRELGGFGD
ncbi:FAD dependent oxidoreductase [Corynespora cassiicola Philippines]|uniref:FAD dependent oxidoreductase n=1 Tax=Corynespora cassiicola Philippines TaxID=1448308 RepID=A0A2T2N326_CORCC|nr:FAD dependent oxidoreductase [Corynespora cassiicola Philippines]